MSTIQDIINDQKDRLENLEAVKGKRYTDAVKFMIHIFRLHSVVAHTLSHQTDDDSSPASLIATLLCSRTMMLETENLFFAYLTSLNYNDDDETDKAEIKDIVEMAHKIHTSSVDHAKSALFN